MDEEKEEKKDELVGATVRGKAVTAGLPATLSVKHAHTALQLALSRYRHDSNRVKVEPKLTVETENPFFIVATDGDPEKLREAVDSALQDVFEFTKSTEAEPTVEAIDAFLCGQDTPTLDKTARQALSEVIAGKKAALQAWAVTNAEELAQLAMSAENVRYNLDRDPSLVEQALVVLSDALAVEENDEHKSVGAVAGEGGEAGAGERSIA